MICRMCLLEADNCINIFDSKGIQLKIASVITKYFWFEPKIDDPISIFVCNECWNHISDFDYYYNKIEVAQSALSEKCFIKEEFEGEENSNNDDMSEIQEDEVTKEASTNTVRRSSRLSANMINKAQIEHIGTVNTAVPRKRGRPRKTTQLISHKRGRPRKVLTSTVQIEQTNLKRKSTRNNQTVIGLKEKSEKIPKPSEYVKRSKEANEYIAKYIKLKCELCPGECTTFAEMRTHYRLSHKRKGYIICCNKKFYRRILLMEHIYKHLNPDFFRCKLCDKTFSDRQCLKSHTIIMHDPEERKIHKCDKCPRSYSKQFMLERHKLIHVPQEERTFFCKPCGKAFPSKNLLHSHTRSVHENAYGIMCHICAKVLQGKTMLAKHQLEHAGIIEPKVQCNECGSWLKHKYSLKKHLERHAEQQQEKLNPQNQVCSICGKISPSKGALRSHIRYVHQARRTHQCKICEKSFKTALTLREHMTTHTGEVLYTCPHCPKTFNSSANMHSHRKKKHRKEWEENRKNRETAREIFKNYPERNYIELPVETVYGKEESELQENS